MRTPILLRSNPSSSWWVIGIDPGLRNVGVSAILLEDIQEEHPIPRLFFWYSTSPEDDPSYQFKSLRQFFSSLFVVVPPLFVFVEDVDMRPFIQRKAQAQLWASVALLLSEIPEYSGYLLVDKVRAKRELGLVVEKGNRKVVMGKKESNDWVLSILSGDFLSRVPSRYHEHILDSVLVLWAGLRMVDIQP